MFVAVTMRPNGDRVIQIIREVATAEIMPRFGRLASADVAEKRGPNDLVTVADTAAEAALGAALGDLWPGSALVGEEAVDADARVLDALAGEGPVWVIDPVDGTNNFARGKACFAVIVALCVGGETVGGWIHDPIADRTVWAEKGVGAWLDSGAGRSGLRLAAAKPVAAMTGSLGYRWARRVRERIRAGAGLPGPRLVRYGCTGREYMDLAAGNLDFAAYSRLKPWDHAAGVLIYGEAGGYARITDPGADGNDMYRALPIIAEGTLLLAPDRRRWQELKCSLGLPDRRAPA